MSTEFADATGDDYEWRDREARKYSAAPPVWQHEPFWENHYSVWNWHLPHISSTDPTQLAFTPSLAYGRIDRQVKLKPGRYLSKFFGDKLTEKQIQFYAQWWTSGTRPENEAMKAVELQFATTADEIVSVYMTGPKSCMDGTQFRHADSHPTRVYAAGDLAVAYFADATDPDKVSARALVWPEKKVFGRVYPTPGTYGGKGDERELQEALFNRLKAAGYKSLQEGASFNGARIVKEESGDGWAMPYLDNSYGVDDSGDEFVMSSSPDYACDSTDGTIEDNCSTCEHCDSRIAEGDTFNAYQNCNGRYGSYGVTLCESCFDSGTFHCEGLGESFVSDRVDHITVDGTTYSQEWAERNGYFFSDHSDEWFGPDAVMTEMSDGTVCTQDEKDEEEPEVEDEDEDEQVVEDDTSPHTIIHDTAQGELTHV